MMLATWCSAVTAAGEDPAGSDFFETKVRPVLAEHCYACHSAQAKKLKGGLLLDSLEGMRKGGETGPAVVPGKPDESLLIQAVRYDDELTKMPPKGKLPAATRLPSWSSGSRRAPPGPRLHRGRGSPHRGSKLAGDRLDGGPQALGLSADRAACSLPPVKNRGLVAVADRSVRPGQAGSRRADAVAAGRSAHAAPPRLLRPDRACRPRPRRSRRSSATAREDAFARVVDRLLASPRYGERWGRHWLDVARYADTKDGVLMFGDDRVRPYAYTYRDYVIRAFNEDLPFDRFVHEQLAADVVAPKDEPWRLAAMGFLTLGRMFDNNIHDQIDDRIDTVTRGLLGLTVACARCHDHKYDADPHGRLLLALRRLRQQRGAAASCP